MKQEIIYELIKKIKSQPNLMRKVKVFVAVGSMALVITGALVIWGGVSAVKFIVFQANELSQSPVASDQIEKLKSEVTGLPRLTPLACWGKAQSLMTMQSWLDRPFIDNLLNLKVACLENTAATCEGAECANTKERLNTDEGRTVI